MIANIVCRGFGFASDGVKWIPTRGFLPDSSVTPVPEEICLTMSYVTELGLSMFYTSSLNLSMSYVTDLGLTMNLPEC